jgi:hypothetical protein
VAVLRTLLVKLGFAADTSGASEFERSVGGVEETLGGLASKARGFALTFGTAVAGAFGVGATRDFIDSQADLAAELDQRRGAIAATREEIQQLGFVARSGGADMDTMVDAVADLSDKTADAILNGAGYKDTLKTLGIESVDAAGQIKKPTDLLFEMADAFARTEDGAFKTFAANDLMGESGARLIPVLNQGSDALRAMMKQASETGAVISDEALDSTLAYRQANLRLGDSLTQLRLRLLAGIIPALTRGADALALWLRNGENVERVMLVLRVATLALGAALAGLAFRRMLSGLSAMMGLLRGALAAVTGLRGGIVALNAAALILPTILAAVVLALQDVSTFVAGGESLTGQLIERFRDAPGVLGAFVRGLEALAPRLAEFFARGQEIARQAIPALIVGLQALGAAFLGMGGGIIRLAIQMAQVLGPVIGEALAQLMPAIRALAQAFGDVAQAFADAFAESLPNLKALASAIVSVVQTLLSAALPLVLAALQLVVTAITLLAPLVSRILGEIAALIRTIVPPIVAVITVIAGVVAFLLEQITEGITALAEFLAPFGAALLAFWSILAGAVGGFLSLLVSGFRAAFAAIMTIVGPVLSALDAAIKGASSLARGTLSGSTPTTGVLGALGAQGALGNALARPAAATATAGAGGSRNLSIASVNLRVDGSGLSPAEMEGALSGALATGITDADLTAAAREVL